VSGETRCCLSPGCPVPHARDDVHWRPRGNPAGEPSGTSDRKGHRDPDRGFTGMSEASGHVASKRWGQRAYPLPRAGIDARGPVPNPFPVTDDRLSSVTATYRARGRVPAAPGSTPDRAAGIVEAYSLRRTRCGDEAAAPRGSRSDTLNRARCTGSPARHLGALPDARVRLAHARWGCGLHPSRIS
jgi:hypothetical protein